MHMDTGRCNGFRQADRHLASTAVVGFGSARFMAICHQPLVYQAVDVWQFSDYKVQETQRELSAAQIAILVAAVAQAF